MNIKWLGHACFLITAKDGRTLLMDPFDDTFGYPLPGVPANVVTCSHKHRDHHAIESLPYGFTVIDQPGKHHTCGFVIEGISCFHDDEQGLARGRNMVYLAEIDGLRIAHMGDLGHQPTAAMREQLQNLDVLLVPVGGTYTLDGDEAAAAVELLKPRIAIPMHYQTPLLNLKLDDEKTFVAHFPHQYLTTNQLELTRATLADYPPVVIMAYGEAGNEEAGGTGRREV
ncbi:MAG: MBL fold metallo-hydrolase [Clostridia bacterium]